MQFGNGPAAVTGNEIRSCATVRPQSNGKARRVGRSGSQKTCLDNYRGKTVDDVTGGALSVEPTKGPDGRIEQGSSKLGAALQTAEV